MASEKKGWGFGGGLAVGLGVGIVGAFGLSWLFVAGQRQALQAVADAESATGQRLADVLPSQAHLN